MAIDWDTFDWSNAQSPLQPEPKPEETDSPSFSPDELFGGGLVIQNKDLENPTLGGEIKKGLVRGGYELGAMGAGLVGLAGDAVGADSVADWGVEKYKELEGKAGENAANVGSTDDIHGLGDAGLYAAGVIAEQIPILIPALASAGAGGIAARTLGRRVVADQVAKRVAEGVAQDIAEKEVGEMVASEAYKKAAQTSIERGATAGAFAGNYGMIAGGSFGQIYDETGEKDAGAAAGYAIPGAALETLFDVYLGKKLLGPIIGEGGNGRDILANTAMTAGESALIEAPTEYIQTGLEQAAVGAADPNMTVGEAISSPEAEKQREQAAIAGATAGAAFGSVGGAVNSFTPKTDAALNTTKLKQPDAPDGGTVVDGAFSEPITLNDDGREFTMVKSNTNGQWFLTNPGEEFANIPKTGPAASWVAINPEILSRRDTIGAALVERANATLSDKLEGVNREGSEEEDDTTDESELEAYDPDLALRQSPLGAELLRNDLKNQQPKMGRAELSARAIVANSDPAEGERLAAINDAKNAEIEKENQRLASIGALNPGTRITYQLPGSEERTGDLFVSGYDEQGNLLVNSSDVSLVDTLKSQLDTDTEFNSIKAEIAKADEKLEELADQVKNAEGYAEGVKGAARTMSPDAPTQEAVQTAVNRVASLRNELGVASAARQDLVLALEENPRRLSLQEGLIKAQQEGQQSRSFTIPPQSFSSISVLGKPLDEETNMAQSPIGAELLRQQLAQQEQESRMKTERTRLLDSRRNPEEANAFVSALDDGDSVTYWPEDGDPVNAKVAGRRENGSLILTTGNRIKGTLKVIDVPKNNFSRIGLQQPKVKLGTINDAISGVLGNNPTTQDVEGAGLRKVAGEAGSYETEIGDGLGSNELPIKVSLYRRKGDKETLVVKSKGLFTNDPRTTLRQINRGLAVEVPETLSLIHPDIQVETIGGKRIVTAVSDKTHNGKTKKVKLNELSTDTPLDYEKENSLARTPQKTAWDTGAFDGLVLTSGDVNAGVFAFQPFTREVAAKLKQSGRKTIDLVDSKFVTTRTIRQSKTDPADIRFDSPLTLRGAGNKQRGIGVADDVLKNDLRFVQKSEAGMIGARGEGQSDIVSENIQSPMSEALQGLYGKLNELDAVDNEILRSGLDRIASYFKGANLAPEVADYAYNASRDELVRAMMTFRGYVLDKEKGEYVRKKGSAPVTPFKNQESVQLSSEFLVALDQARENRKAELPAKIKKYIDKIEADEEKQNEAVRKRGGTVSALTAAEKEKAAISAIERGDDATLRDAVQIAGAGKSAAQKRTLESIKNRYKKGGRLNVLTLAAKNVAKAKRFTGNPMASIQKNIVDAERMLARRGNLFSKESLDKPAEGAAETPAQVNAGVAQSKVSDNLRTSPDRDFFEEKQNWQKRAFSTLTPGDLVILSRGTGNLEDGEKPLNQKEKQRYGLLKRYLASGGVGSDGKYPELRGDAQGNTLGGRPAGVSAREIPLNQYASGESLSGVMESRAPRIAGEGTQGRPDDVGGSDAGAAGAVSQETVQRDGGPRLGALEAAKVRQLGESARRRFVQSFAGLTEEELGKLSIDEINALTAAITSSFDESAAKASRNAISGTAVPAEDLVNRGASELVSRYAEGLKEYQENKARITRMRDNARRLVLAGAFKSPTDLLNTVALGDFPQDMKLRAKAMLSVGGRGFNFNDLAVQLGRFQTAEDKDTTWGGIISEDGRDIAINLDSAHDRGDIVQTYLHELQHALTIAKVDRTIPLTPIEERALGRLEAIRQDAVIRAARREKLSVPANPSPADIARLSGELYDKSDVNREFGGLRSLREFAVEVSGSPDLAALMADLGFGSGKPDSSLKSMVSAVKNAWSALTSLITGRVIDANSPLARAFTDSWIINFGGEAAGGSGGTVPTITKSSLRETLGRLREQGSWINDQINERGLAGTAEDRNKLAGEYGKAMVARGEEAAPIAAEELPSVEDTAPAEVTEDGAPPINPFEVNEEGEEVYQTDEAPIVDAADQGDLSWMGAESRAPKNPDFYSQLERTIADKMPNKASVEQLRAIIDPAKGSGVKPDEIKWSNLEGFLDGKSSVTKQEVMDYLKEEGSVKFEERLSGKDSKLKAMREAAARYGFTVEEDPDDGAWRFYNKLGVEVDDEVLYEEYPELDGEVDIIDATQGERYAEYSMSGGKNYREVVLTAPTSVSMEEYEALLKKNYGDRGLTESILRGRLYVSSHFPGIPDYIAHMRLNERKDSTGKEGLFIEEIQSDRHQAGRKKGYAGELSKIDTSGWTAEPSWMEGMWSVSDAEGNPVMGSSMIEKSRFPAEAKAIAEAARLKDEQISSGAAPDAPFRKDWSVQMFKRALRDAVASGKEWIGWTDGETQNDRYPGRTEGEQKGMAKFYDEILPNEIGKYVKKWGAKVEQGGVMVEKRDSRQPVGGRLILDDDEVDRGASVPESIDYQEAPIWKIQITPEMRKAVETQGQPLYSKAPKVNWKPLVKPTYTGGTYTAPGKLSVDNKLDPRAGERFRERGREISVANNRVEYFAKELNRLIQSTYPKGTAPLELMNTALGSIESPLTRTQIQEIEAVADPSNRSDLRDRYLRENREAFRAKQKAALESLPEPIAKTIGEMTSQIAELSRILKDENIIGDSLEATVDANLGIYLNRSYEIFDNPEWADKVRKNPTIIGNARKYIRDIMVKNKAAKLMDDSEAPLSNAAAMSQASDMVTPEEVERALENYLAVAEDGPSVQVLAGRVPGQKNLSILTERGTIAPEIQALWGVRVDPSANYANTFTKMSALIANDRFLKDLKAMGLKEGWLYDPEAAKGDPDARVPRGFTKIASESNKTLAPLNGIYAMPELAYAMTEMFPADASENQAAWLNAAMKLTGLSMASKTVWSATSQVRNGLSNILNLAAAGNLSLGDITSGKAFSNAGFAKNLIMANSFGNYKADPKVWRAEIEEMVRLGVLGESVTGNLLNELMEMNRAAEKGTLPETLFQKLSTPVKAASGFAQKTYAAGDDLFKVMHYLSEKQKYRKAFPTMSEADLKNLAAKNARDIHWTYSLAPDVVKDIKKFPFVAPFITFTTEVIRTSINLGKLAHSEITEGRRTGNRELEKIGWQRARGMATAAILPGAVASAAMAMAGISGDDEDDLRRFLPDWQKNNQLLMFKKENGEVSFVDISYLDPYTYLKKPVNALLRSLHNPESAQQVIVDGALGAAKEALSPFMSEQIFAGAIMDVMRNRDASGRQVYNPQDSAASIGAAVAGKLIYDPFVPGTVTSLGRVYKAAAGETSESGRDYSLGNEVASMFAGQRVSAVDAQQALAFKAATFGREMRDASALFGKQFTGRGTRSEGQVASGYEKANEAHMELVNNLRKDYLASIRLGLSEQQATKVLKDANVGTDLLRMVKSGVYRRYEASTAAANLAKTRPDKTRMAGYTAALKQTPRTQPLSDR
jgi:hypothetical protein